MRVEAFVNTFHVFFKQCNGCNEEKYRHKNAKVDLPELKDIKFEMLD